MMKRIYLDYAAATPLDPDVLETMRPYFTEKFYNPSALYESAQEVRRDLDTARAMVAQTIGARPVEITFSAGGTEANNLAIHGLMRQYPEAKILISAIEHESVQEPARQYEYSELPVDEHGYADLVALRRQIDDRTVLISLMYANNEIGTIQPIREVAAFVDTMRRDRLSRGVTLPLYLHTDAAQAGNYLDLHVARLGVDLMTLNGGKVYGPKQSGALYVRSGVRLQPQILGGGQEKGLRSGTENVAGAIGFAHALAAAQDMHQSEVHRLQGLQKLCITLLQQHIPGIIFNGGVSRRLPNNIHITIPGQDNERLIFGLDERGIQAAAGSACSASSDQPSHVLAAIGMGDAGARASLRFSMGRATTEQDIRAVVAALADILA